MEYRGSSIMEHYYPPLFHLLPLRSFSAFKLSKDLNPAICFVYFQTQFLFHKRTVVFHHNIACMVHAYEYIHSCKFNLQENIFTLSPFSLSQQKLVRLNDGNCLGRVENCSEKQSFVI